MQYKVTKQYLREAESLSAEFINSNDAIFFINMALQVDERINVKTIYYLLDDHRQKTVQEFNKWKSYQLKYRHPSEYPNFAAYNLLYTITQSNPDVKYAFAKFSTLNDAKAFVEERLATDASHNENITYYLLEGDTLIEQSDQTTFNESQAQSSKKEQKLAFRPTPFPTALRLGPPKWVVDDENEEDKKE